MKIHVTHKHIDEGVMKSCQHCPVALAVIGATGVAYASINIRRIRWGNTWGQGGMGWEERETPDAVKTFMRKYDHREPVRPIEFELETA